MAEERNVKTSSSLDVVKLRDALKAAGLAGFLAAGATTGATDAFADCSFCTNPCVACTSGCAITNVGKAAEVLSG